MTLRTRSYTTIVVQNPMKFSVWMHQNAMIFSAEKMYINSIFIICLNYLNLFSHYAKFLERSIYCNCFYATDRPGWRSDLRQFVSSPEPKVPRWAISIPVTSASVRQHFQTFPLKPQGQLNLNFIWRLLRLGEQKFVQMVLVTLPRWPPCPYTVKTL